MTDAQFYKSKRWQHLRALILKRDKYQCQLSKRYGKILQADMVHHIFPREQFPEYQWEPWNLISLSNEMHNKLHDRVTNNLTADGIKLLIKTAKAQGIEEPTMPFNKTLVIGLPGTGKTTYTRNNLGESGLAYDLDAIAAAFRLRQPHEEYNDESRRMANDLLLSFAENASDYTNEVLIIRTAPTIAEVEEIKPTKVVWRKEKYVERQIDNEQETLLRIKAVVEWCSQNNIFLEISPPAS